MAVAFGYRDDVLTGLRLNRDARKSGIPFVPERKYIDHHVRILQERENLDRYLRDRSGSNRGNVTQETLAE